MADIPIRVATGAVPIHGACRGRDRLRARAQPERCAEAIGHAIDGIARLELVEMRRDDYEDLSRLLVRADKALYLSKDAGRNRVTWAP